MVNIQHAQFIAFLYLMVSALPVHAMEKKEKRDSKKTFGAVIKQLEKKGEPKRISDASGIHGHFNPAYGQQGTTKLGYIQAIKKGDVVEVKRIAEKHSSYVKSPQLTQIAVDAYADEPKNSSDAQAKKAIVGAIIKNCKNNEVLAQLVPKTPSVNDAIEMIKLSNEGDLGAVKVYMEEKAKKEKKKKKGSLSSFFAKKEELSSSDSSLQSGE